MLTNFVFMIPFRSKRPEDVIKAYLTGEYSTFGGSKCILSDQGSGFTSKQFTFLAKEFNLIQIATTKTLVHGQGKIKFHLDVL